jgi:hypothetical protein
VCVGLVKPADPVHVLATEFLVVGFGRGDRAGIVQVGEGEEVVAGRAEVQGVVVVAWDSQADFGCCEPILGNAVRSDGVAEGGEVSAVPLDAEVEGGCEIVHVWEGTGQESEDTGLSRGF